MPITLFTSHNPRVIRTSEAVGREVKSGNASLPIYLGRSPGIAIRDTAPNTTNLNLSSFRTERTLGEVVRSLVRVSPDLSQAVVTKIMTALSDQYTAYAVGIDGMIDRPATEALHLLLNRLNFGASDYRTFSRTTDLRSLSESLLLDYIRYGAMSGEVVLDKARLPARIKHFPSRLVQWKTGTGREYPYYTYQGEEKSLDYPTFIYISSLQDGETAYANSQIEAAIQPVLFEEEFKSDLRRAVRNVILPRLKVVINTDKWKKTLPLDVQYDSDRLSQVMSETISELEDRINGLNPEDCLVAFDVLDPSYMTHGNISTDRDIKVLQSLLSGNVASGAKTLPAVLGKSETQGAGSAESMIFMKGVEGMQELLNTFLSRALTIAVRVMGFDVYVRYALADVNLRPKEELEAFRAMKQSRIFEMLSFGFITDDEAAIRLTGHLPPATFQPLSGTRFTYMKADTSNNAYSNTSVDPGRVDDSTDGKSRKSDAPTGAKSK